MQDLPQQIAVGNNAHPWRHIPLQGDIRLRSQDFVRFLQLIQHCGEIDLSSLEVQAPGLRPGGEQRAFHKFRKARKLVLELLGKLRGNLLGSLFYPHPQKSERSPQLVRHAGGILYHFVVGISHAEQEGVDLRDELGQNGIPLRQRDSGFQGAGSFLRQRPVDAPHRPEGTVREEDPNPEGEAEGGKPNPDPDLDQLPENVVNLGVRVAAMQRPVGKLRVRAVPFFQVEFVVEVLVGRENEKPDNAG